MGKLEHDVAFYFDEIRGKMPIRAADLANDKIFQLAQGKVLTFTEI